MRRFCFMLICPFIFSLSSYAQTDSSVAKPWKTPFKRGYIRLGLNMLGSDLNPSLSPLENIKKGNLGADNGYTLEFGHIFYFLSRKKQRIFNAGLDWTIISLAYNPLDKWKGYASQRNENVDLGTPLHASATSKLGPVIAVNPVSKLVIEARFQLTYALHYSAFDYYVEKDNDQSYEFWLDDENYFNTRGMGTNIGATVRYGFIGLAVDLSNAKIPTTFYLSQNGQQETSNTEKIAYKHIQLKLSFTL